MENKSAISLLEFNSRIARQLRVPHLLSTWVMAELSDVAVRGGHCYLELIEKDAVRGHTVAKVRGIIWANTYAHLHRRFEQVTGQPLKGGIKVMVEVSVNFHEQFGLSLVISNINPEFTLGDIVRRRNEILRRLQQEGIFNMNRELEWCRLPQRIAIISAPSAAGYEDFMKQIRGNSSGIVFYTALFAATMQGANTPQSVMDALDRVYEYIDMFDCVVIIRGGGSTSDLISFDDYDLAAHVAQFPIPVITGIGHERDNTVIDYVANVRVKTPTAAAEWLVERCEQELALVNDLSQAVIEITKEYLSGAKEQLAYYRDNIPFIVQNKLVVATSALRNYGEQIPMIISGRVATAQAYQRSLSQQLQQSVDKYLQMERMRIRGLEGMVSVLSPVNTLKRGYSISRVNGRAITSIEQLKSGDELTTILPDGKKISIIK